MSAELNKLPPQALDLEEAILGAILLEKDALALVIDKLKEDHFYSEKHAKVFKAVKHLYASVNPVDILTVTEQMRKDGTIESIGGPWFITNLTNKVSSAANIEYHTMIIIEKYIMRQIISIGSFAQSKAYEADVDPFSMLDKLEGDLFALQQNSIKKEARSAQVVLVESRNALQKRMKRKGRVVGIPTGFNRLDDVTAGWQAPDLIIVAARPGMGKTAWVLSTLRECTVSRNIPAAIFSLEMSAHQLMDRVMSAESKVTSEGIRKGTLTNEEYTVLDERTDHKSRLSNAPLYIDDTPGLSIVELRSKARRLKMQHDIKLIVVDYLQLMSGDMVDKYRSNGNREQEIATISRGLKNVAKELNVPVIALSQLSRSVETRGGDKRPELSDLRESGAIEQDADLVMFLWRPAYYGMLNDVAGIPYPDGYTEQIISKHRNGSLEDVPLQFIGQYVEFLDLN